jgi:hypothetical protein
VPRKVSVRPSPRASSPLLLSRSIGPQPLRVVPTVGRSLRKRVPGAAGGLAVLDPVDLPRLQARRSTGSRQVRR